MVLFVFAIGVKERPQNVLPILMLSETLEAKLQSGLGKVPYLRRGDVNGICSRSHGGWVVQAKHGDLIPVSLANLMDRVLSHPWKTRDWGKTSPVSHAQSILLHAGSLQNMSTLKMSHSRSRDSRP